MRRAKCAPWAKPFRSTNLRPVLWPSREVMIEQLNQLAFAADWVLPGLKEGQILTGQSTPEGIADFYLERGVQAVIIKTGPDGAWFKTAAGDKAAVAAVKVDNVVDTVGAGDGFAVGTLSALLEGKTLIQAVQRGNKIGSWRSRPSATAKACQPARRWPNNNKNDFSA